MPTRLEQLRSLLVTETVQAALIGAPANRRYLSGFTGSHGWLFVTAADARLLTDGRYLEQVKRQCPEFSVIALRRGDDAEIFKNLLESIRGGRVALEVEHVTLDQWQRWFEPIDVEWVFHNGLVEGLRAIKEPAEIAAIQKAANLADTAMAYATAIARPGMTEEELAWALHVYLHDHGASGPAFETIVASGPNSALPHARPSARVIQRGEPVTVDLGARLANGYNSDLTRTFCLGRPSDDRFLAVYQAVREGHRQALANLRPGLSGVEADGFARSAIAEAGFGDYFVHSLGHGVGLEVHEKPWVSSRSTDTLQTGQVVTVEPGGGGVRIEDLALITEDGCRLLSHAGYLPVIEF